MKSPRFEAKKPYMCGFCGKRTKRPYSIVDGAKSCPKCDREWTVIYNKVICPTCKGVGHFITDTVAS